jgi:hypothetical protein
MKDVLCRTARGEMIMEQLGDMVVAVWMLNMRRLDDLILELNDSLSTTMVVVTHELASIFAIGSNPFFWTPPNAP